MPRLRIRAGPTLTDLAPLAPNSDVPLHIKSDGFEGQVAVYIKGFDSDLGPDGAARGRGGGGGGGGGHSAYFEHERRKGITWSIQLQGRFLETMCADDILFGNIFDRPLKLPWGFGAVLKFMRYVDPTLTEHFLSRTRPWAFSPFVATMPHIQHTRTDGAGAGVGGAARRPPFPCAEDPVVEDTSGLRYKAHSGHERNGQGHGHERGGHGHERSGHERGNGQGHGKAAWHRDRKQRKAHFASEARRKEVVFGPNDLITADFCHHYLHFSPTSIVLKLPCGVALDLLRYWDGQPVRFVCCARARPGERADGLPWGRVFFCVVLECGDGDEDDGDAESVEKVY